MTGATARAISLCLTVVLVTACTSGPITQSAFVRTVTEGASLLTAASATLRRVRGDPPTLTVEYGKGSFINYHELVLPIPESLPQLDGAPDQATVDQLVAMLNASLSALATPCLVGECDWETQIRTFDEASDALLAAAE
jgi:hypothetical protein